MIDSEEIYQLIEDIENRQSKLNEWEIEFMDSISNQISEKGSLTEKQLHRLNELWEKVTF